MSKIKSILKYLLAFFFVGAGINHFLHPDFYINIMPPYLPWHRELVYLSGVLEIVVGVMVFLPPFTALAGWGIIALLIAFMPVHIHMVVHTELYPDIKPLLLWLRLPLQGLFVLWAYWVTRQLQTSL